MQQQGNPPAPDPKPPADAVALLIQAVIQNPVIAAIVGGAIFGLWVIGKASKKPGLPEEVYSEGELKDALHRLEQKKISSSPEMKQIIDELKDMRRRMDELKPPIPSTIAESTSAGG